MGSVKSQRTMTIDGQQDLLLEAAYFRTSSSSPVSLFRTRLYTPQLYIYQNLALRQLAIPVQKKRRVRQGRFKVETLFGQWVGSRQGLVGEQLFTRQEECRDTQVPKPALLRRGAGASPLALLTNSSTQEQGYWHLCIILENTCENTPWRKVKQEECRDAQISQAALLPLVAGAQLPLLPALLTNCSTQDWHLECII